MAYNDPAVSHSMSSLSVVLLHYNHMACLPRALAALLNQKRLPDEILLVDDGSNPEELAAVRELARCSPLIRLLENGENRGIIETMNRGLYEAKGDFIYFAAADDETAPAFFERAMGELEKHPHAHLCMANHRVEQSATGRVLDEVVPLPQQSGWVDGKVFRAMLRDLDAFRFSGGTVLLRRSILVEMGGFSQEMRWAADWYAYGVVALKHGFVYVPETLFTLHEGTSTYSGSQGLNREAVENVLRVAVERVERGEAPEEMLTPSFLCFSHKAAWQSLGLYGSRPEWLGRYAPLIFRKYFRKPMWDLVSNIILPMGVKSLVGAKQQLLRFFGAKIIKGATIEPWVSISHPWNLEMEEGSCLRKGCRVENPVGLRLGKQADVGCHSLLTNRTIFREKEKWVVRLRPLEIKAYDMVGDGEVRRPDC